MPPPPLKWQPVQFIWLNSCSPSAIASLLSSNRAPTGSCAGGAPPFGKRPVTETDSGPRSASGAAPCCAVASLAERARNVTTAIGSRCGPATFGSGSRQGEDIERPSGCSLRFEISHDADHAERAGRIARVKVAGDDGARPAAYARQDGDILVPIRPAIGDGLADDPGAGLELPFEVACLGVDGFEPAIHRSVKDESTCSGHRAAPQRQVLFDGPDRLALYWIPRGEFATIAARARLAHYFGADERGTGDVADGPALPIHAQILVRNVHKAGQRRKG